MKLRKLRKLSPTILHQPRPFPQHLPRQIHSFQDAVVIQDAVFEDAVFYGAVIEEDGVFEAAALDRGAVAEDDAAFAEGVFKGGGVAADDGVPGESTCGGEVAVEGADVEPGFGEREETDGCSETQQFLENTADVVRLNLCKREQDSANRRGEDGGARAYEGGLWILGFFLECCDCVMRSRDNGAEALG